MFIVNGVSGASLHCINFGVAMEIIIPSLIQGMGKIKKCALAVYNLLLGCVDRPGHPGYFYIAVQIGGIT